MVELIKFQELGLTNNHGQAVVSSRMVAQKFGKQHGHVLRDIEKLLEGLSKIGESGSLNFAESSYKNEQNKKQPEYLINRDGFALLVMGFTGKRALQFKTAYISAFNQMESYIKDMAELRLEYRPLTDAIQSAHNPTMSYHYSNENDMMYRILTGKTSSILKKEHGIPKELSLRPALSTEDAKLLVRMQRINTELIVAGLGFHERKEILTNIVRKERDKQNSLLMAKS